MKKFLLIGFLFSSLLSIGQLSTTTIVCTGATFTKIYDPTELPNVIFVIPTGGNVTLSGNINIDASGVPAIGTHWRVQLTSQFVLNGHTITIFGQDIKSFYVDPALANGWYFDFFSVGDAIGTPVVKYNSGPYDLNLGNELLGTSIIDGTLTLSKLDTVGSARFLLGNGSNVVSSAKLGGDVTCTNTGIVTIADSAVTNAKVAGNAGIIWSKLATGSNNQVAITSSGGVLTTEATLNPIRGGLGANVSSSIGFVTFSSGSATVGAITNTRDLHVSFASTGLGTYYLTFPVPVTVTNIEVRVETTLGGTDSATVAPQDNSGTTMGGSNLNAGLLVLAASATTGTGYISTLTLNNTFTAGQRMRLITNKGTAGGTANIQITYTRVN